MGNTTFYYKAKNDKEKIDWKDIFSEYKKKHTKSELEYALTAGTSLNTATEKDMLAKWQKPWMFYPLLKGGLILLAIMYGVFLAMYYVMGGYTDSLFVMTQIIPPLIIPIILMIFIWELNIPRNISIYELLAVFLVGGFLSFAATSVMWKVIGEGPGIFSSSFAGFREEPAKLIAAVIWLVILGKQKKIYGITGLVIGAAVGSGFSGFESISYAMRFADSGGFESMIEVQIKRLIYAIGGHTIYAAPYVGALALAMKREGKLTGSCFLDRDFLLTFASSTALHFIWNAHFWNEGLESLIKSIIIIILLWIELLYILRKCLYEVVSIGRYQGQQNSVRAGQIAVKAIKGAIKGAIWFSKGEETLLIGREGGQFNFPSNARGISRKHCSIQLTQQGWTVRDLNSSYGTYINDGRKLAPGIDWPLHNGDIIYLAEKEQAFQVLF